jgi:5-(carboxyamino)imidazole ribonucleotide synthase
VVTFDWENVSVESLEASAAGARIQPPPRALAAAQDRLPRRTVRPPRHPTTRYAAVDSRADLQRALARIGLPGVLKTRRLGYDGKGQAVLRTAPTSKPPGSALGGDTAASTRSSCRSTTRSRSSARAARAARSHSTR